MNRKILIAIIIIVVVALLLIFKPFGNKNNNGTTGEFQVSALTELFPTKSMTYKYDENGQKYDVKVTDVSKNEDATVVTTERKTKVDNTETTIKMKYEITSEKVVESGEYLESGNVVSIIYPTEIIVGGIAVGSEWKSVDGLITNKITKAENNQVTIESTRKVDEYNENTKTSTQKDYTEVRVFEKGKGLVTFSIK